MAAVIAAFAGSFLGMSHGLFWGFVATMLAFGIFWTSRCYFLGQCDSEFEALRVIFFSQVVIGFCYLVMGSIYAALFDQDSIAQLVICFFGCFPGIVFFTTFIYFALGIFIEFCRQVVK